MKRSRNYYLKRLDQMVHSLIDEKNVVLEELTLETSLGLESVIDDYILSKFLTIGDTAFNRDGYRNATDKIIEHFKLYE